MMKFGIIIRTVNGDTYAHVCEEYGITDRGDLVLVTSSNRQITYNLANTTSVDVEKLDGYKNSRMPTDANRATEDEEAWIDDNVDNILF